MHYGSKQGDIEALNQTPSHELGGEHSEQASEQMSAAEHASKANNAQRTNAAERASKASRVEQVNE